MNYPGNLVKDQWDSSKLSKKTISRLVISSMWFIAALACNAVIPITVVSTPTASSTAKPAPTMAVATATPIPAPTSTNDWAQACFSTTLDTDCPSTIINLLMMSLQEGDYSSFLDVIGQDGLGFGRWESDFLRVIIDDRPLMIPALEDYLILREPACLGYDITYSSGAPSKFSFFITGASIDIPESEMYPDFDIVVFVFHNRYDTFNLFVIAPVSEEAFEFHFGDGSVLLECP